MTARHDAYRSMAGHYDLHAWDWYARSHGPRLLSLLGERGVSPGSAILDVGCGTGSLALLLAGSGYRVTGVDLSEEMIARARAKDLRREVDWRVGDIASLSLGATFAAAVSVADVFNHLETADAWETALRSLHDHLAPGGLAFIDALTCRGLAQLDQQAVQERGGVTLILAIVYEPAARRSTVKVTSFAPSPLRPGLYDRAQETITEWGQPVAEVLRRFERAGFSNVERAWTQAQDAEDDDRMTIVARRP